MHVVRFFDKLYGLESKQASCLALGCLSIVTTFSRLLPHSLYVFLRRILTALLVSDPLRGEIDGQIEVLIPCAEKDNTALQYCIEGAMRNLTNVTRIVVATPASNVEGLINIFKSNPLVQVVNESQFLPQSIQDFITDEMPRQIRGWATQQAIKIWGALSSPSKATLVLDSDTILLKKRTLLDENGRQVLLAAHEYHEPYFAQLTSHWPELSGKAPCSFVAHHQVFCKEVLLEMFPGGSKDIVRWLNGGDLQATGAPFSEFESYGQFIISKQNHNYRFAKWANSSLPREILDGLPVGDSQSFLSSQFCNHFSVSVHSYNT